MRVRVSILVVCQLLAGMMAMGTAAWARQAQLRATDEKTIGGAVLSVQPATALVRARIIISADNGAEEMFIVRPVAVVYDTDGTFLSLTDLLPGKRVEVSYRIDPETREQRVFAVKLLPVPSPVPEPSVPVPAQQTEEGEEYIK